MVLSIEPHANKIRTAEFTIQKLSSISAVTVLGARTSNNLYRKLGLDKDASPATIHRAYRTLAKAYHPDGTAADEVMEKAFVENAAAAEILRDPKKRSLYDRGYVNDFGDLTSAGARREQRRSQRVLGSVSILSFLVAFPVAIWSITGIQRGPVI